MSGERIDSVYRVTFSDGSTCHYGNHATATAYARGGKVEEVSLTKPCRSCESLARVVMLDQTYDERGSSLQPASELALGILWMIDDKRGKARAAFDVLLEAIGKGGLRRGIKRAIDAGYEADHTPSADWWVGKKEKNT